MTVSFTWALHGAASTTPSTNRAPAFPSPSRPNNGRTPKSVALSPRASSAAARGRNPRHYPQDTGPFPRTGPLCPMAAWRLPVAIIGHRGGTAHAVCMPTACRRALGRRVRRIHLRLGLDHFPLGPVDVPQGHLPQDQCSADDAHTAGGARSFPGLIHISDGKILDVNVLELLVPEPGATYIMDRACVDFRHRHKLDQAGAFFLTRAKKNCRARRVYSAPTDRTLGVKDTSPSSGSLPLSRSSTRSNDYPHVLPAQDTRPRCP